MSDFISPDDLANELKIPVRTVYRWNHERTGPPPIRIGKHVRYRREDVEAWLEQHTQDRSADAVVA